jgi:cellulose synthase/poly-beta-1,6-N-acetylglucosamine synthase-like glycosyltransferase
VRKVPYLIGRVSLYRRTVLDEVGTFNPYLFAEEEPELALRIRHAGYHLVELEGPAGFHHSEEQPETFSSLLARWDRKFLLAEGQILRHLYGTPLFWRYALERGFALVPALTLLIAIVTFALSLLTKQWRFFGWFVIGGTLTVASYAIRKRSLYKTAVSLCFRMLSIVGAVKGVLIETPPANTYLVDPESTEPSARERLTA